MRRLERSDDAESAHPFDIFQSLHPRFHVRPAISRCSRLKKKKKKAARGRLTHQDLRMLDSPLDLGLRLAHLCIVVAISTLREGHVAQEGLVNVQHDRVGAVTDPVRAELETLDVCGHSKGVSFRSSIRQPRGAAIWTLPYLSNPL